MSTLIDEQTYTVDDLLTLPDADRFELRHGHLVERDMGTNSDRLAARMIVIVGSFLETHPLGYVFGSETSYACFPDEPRHAPRPDASVIRFGRLPEEIVPEGHCRIPPDLVVEVVSPNDSAEELSNKVAEFQSVGVPLIWVVYPGTKRILIHRLPTDPAGRVSEVTEGDQISGEGVLPGFVCNVSDIFRLPKPPAGALTTP